MKKISTMICAAVLLAVLTGCSPKVNKAPQSTYDPLQSPPVYETLILYFPSKDGTQLLKEPQVIEITSDLSSEELVLKQLQKGPKGENMTAAIPSNVEILSVATTDGICVVDLSENFSECSANAVQSIVHSLCELDEIDAVKINIAGNTDAQVNADVSLASPLSPLAETNV